MSSSSDDELTTSRRTLLKGAVAAGVGVAAYHPPIVSSVPVYATHGLSSIAVQGQAFCITFSPNHDGMIFPPGVPAGNLKLLGDWDLDKTGANTTLTPGTYDQNEGGATTYTLNPITVANQYPEPGSYIPPTNGDTQIEWPRNWFRFNVPVVDALNNKSTVTSVGWAATGTKVAGSVTIEWSGNPNNSEVPDYSYTQLQGGTDPNLAKYTTAGYHGGGVGIRLLEPECEFEVLAITCGHKCEPTSSDQIPPASWSAGSSRTNINQETAPNGNVDNPWQGDHTRTVYYHSGSNDHDGTDARCKFSMVFRVNCRV